MVETIHSLAHSQRKVYEHNDHYMCEMPSDQGCQHWVRIRPDHGIAKIQRLRTKPGEKNLWPAEDIAGFRLKKMKRDYVHGVLMNHCMTFVIKKNRGTG